MLILGIDEVGRGAWAGPLVAGAVILSSDISGLADSKTLSRSQRESLNIRIIKESISYRLGWVSPNEIDKLGLSAAVGLAMKRALGGISTIYDKIIIDGNINFLKDNPKSVSLIRADQTVSSVSAASIIAKVARDNYMRQIALKYPEYAFERHVGYGTAKHKAALDLFGPSLIHRLSFKPLRQV